MAEDPNITERNNGESGSLALRDELTAELEAMANLHTLAIRLMATTELQPLLKEILNATIALQEADFGNIQLYNAETQALEIAAQVGFRQDFLDYFSSVRETGAACGRAMQQRARVIIEDVQTDPGFAPHRHIAASAGFRAVQSTPLFNYRGEFLGMLSTHFRKRHRPSARELRLTDLYAAQAAQMIERKRIEEELRRSEERNRVVIDTANEAFIAADAEGRITDWNRQAELTFGWSRAEAIGQLLAQTIIPTQYREAHTEGLRHFLATGQGPVLNQRIEMTALHHDGHEFPVELTITAIRLGPTYIFNSFLHDITARKQVEQALRKSEEKFRLLVEGVQEYAIYMLDPIGRVTSWNSGAESIIGYQTQEIIGQHYSRFFSQEDIERGKPAQQLTVAAGEGRYEGEDWRVRKDGSRFWANVVITALRDAAGNLIGFSKVTRDVTERKQSEARFRGLLETAPDAMVIANSDGRIELVNSQTEQLFGYPRDELLGQPVEKLVPERFRVFHSAHRAGYSSNPQVRPMGAGLELYGQRKDGTQFPVEISLSPQETPEGVLVSAAIRDVTARKQTEEALVRQKAELARSNMELAAANKELEAFTYSVSHDLRAPLRHISGFSQILAEEFGPRMDARAQHCLQHVQKGVQGMGQLIDDLLNLGRVGRQTLKEQPTDLNSLVAAVLADLKPETERRQIEWQIGPLPSVKCDPGLVKLLFANLLSNAIKFTRHQERATIQVGQMKMEGEQLFFVRDNGVGFNMRYADKLFGIFQRLHRQEDFEGTGVGLANVRRIIHKHSGRIWAEAEPYKGATFYFTLAILQESSPESKTAAVAGE
jgi:PAS domain S-box-containing protein